MATTRKAPCAMYIGALLVQGLSAMTSVTVRGHINRNACDNFNISKLNGQELSASSGGTTYPAACGKPRHRACATAQQEEG